MNNHRTVTRTEIVRGFVTLGNAKTAHSCNVEIGYNANGDRVTITALGTDCGTDRFRNARQYRKAFTSTRITTDCKRCQAAHA
jgi:hypothetical protein